MLRIELLSPRQVLFAVSSNNQLWILSSHRSQDKLPISAAWWLDEDPEFCHLSAGIGKGERVRNAPSSVSNNDGLKIGAGVLIDGP
jgi:hypothetical protein